MRFWPGGGAAGSWPMRKRLFLQRRDLVAFRLVTENEENLCPDSAKRSLCSAFQVLQPAELTVGQRLVSLPRVVYAFHTDRLERSPLPASFQRVRCVP